MGLVHISEWRSLPMSLGARLARLRLVLAKRIWPGWRFDPETGEVLLLPGQIWHHWSCRLCKQ